MLGTEWQGKVEVKWQICCHTAQEEDARTPLCSSNYSNRETNWTTFYGPCHFCTWQKTCFKSEVHIWWAKKPTFPCFPWIWIRISSQHGQQPLLPSSLLCCTASSHGVWWPQPSVSTTLGSRPGFPGACDLAQITDAFPSLSLRAKWG